jgi:hypothetical protein
VPAADGGVLSVAGRVAGEIAHDFNNQLSIVLNYSFILLRELPQESALREHVSDMQSAAWRASEVARQLLRFGSARSIEPVTLDVNQLVLETHQLLGYVLRGTTRVERRLADDVWPVHARRAHLEWLLVELAMHLRARLGSLEYLRIATCNAPPEAAQDARSVSVFIDAYPAYPASAYEPPEQAQQSQDDVEGRTERTSYVNDIGVSGFQPAERTLAHAEAHLTLQSLPGSGLRYQVRIPAT